MTRPALFFLLGALAACGGGEPGNEATSAGRSAQEPGAAARPPKSGEPPRRVVIEHILISFEGAPDDRAKSLRPKAEAEKLARRLLERARSGVSFELLKREYSEDRNKETQQPLGPYTIVNDGVSRRGREIPRKSYFKNLGDLAFFLQPGEIGLAEFHPKYCPQGWHIVKRVK